MSDRRLYAIGDIHGYFEHFAVLIRRLADDGMDPARDTVVFLGDYIDRGPESRDVVELVRAWTDRYPHWMALRGNHEQLMIDALKRGPDDWSTWVQWWYQGGRQTVASFAGVRVSDVQPKDARSIPPDVVTWMKKGLKQSWIHDPSGYAFVHAGFRPIDDWMTKTSREDRIWIRDEFLESDFNFGHIIVHGHTPVEEPVVRPNRIGIDTMLRGGYLTAVELSGPEPRFIRSDP